MSSGLQYPWHQHEAMFFKVDHMEYAKKIELEKQPDTLFEYNNINEFCRVKSKQTIYRPYIFQTVNFSNITL